MSKEIKVEYQEIWEVKKTSFGGFFGEKLLCALANGYPIYVADGFVVENKKVSKEELDNKFPQKDKKKQAIKKSK
jgi:hypothetical protein